MNKIVVAGATGIAGTAAIRHFRSLPDWDVIALSRRRPADPAVYHMPVDLLDAEESRRSLQSLEGVTHLAYMALFEQDDLLAGWREQSQMEANLAMLQNVVDGLEQSSSALQHITILQGSKAYGSHLKPVPVPAKERWPRGAHKIFYWQQEDFLRERQRNAAWNFTILRPMMILGESIGSPMSIIAAIGVYASVMRQLGEPLHYPGGGRYVISCTDSRLIAQAVEFAGTHRLAPGDTFNVVNGDVIVWHDLWPSVAKHFGMAVGDHRPMRLAEEMPKFAAVWDAIAAEHGLHSTSMNDLVGGAWQFADYNFAYGQDNPPERIIMSPIKFRQAGFTPCYDTEDSILYWLTRMQEASILPR
ncbi:SDR family oxidoreductase [Microvirga zambiensis]|uniref:SDR family oxidoreductase n=1 Tax=Microvirga zambiensis TaxID=1402137 RepID=UPI00191FC873|nr:SDR family oxidoreductase [Microvirga zambiensis]